MIKSIRVKKNSFEEEILLFKELDNIKKINILFGGNGVGKTTFLNGIKDNSLEIDFEGETEIIQYTNSKDNIRNMGNNISHFYKEKPSVYLSGKEVYEMVYANRLSEGQSIVYSLLRFIRVVEEKIKFSKKDIVLIFDEVDSGLSCENINMFLHLISDLINENTNKNIQIFISTNNYHFVHVFKVVLNMYEGKYRKIENYEEYFNLLAENMVELGKKRSMNFI